MNETLIELPPAIKKVCLSVLEDEEGDSVSSCLLLIALSSKERNYKELGNYLAFAVNLFLQSDEKFEIHQFFYRFFIYELEYEWEILQKRGKLSLTEFFVQKYLK